MGSLVAKLKDVSDMTGLSISTISYVLNGKKKVKEATYQKIMKAIEEIGYTPNLLARSLKTRITLTIGICIPEISNEFFTEIVQGIDAVASMQDYSIILCNTNDDAEREKKLVNSLLSKNIDGILFIGAAKSNAILDNKINLPIVMVDRNLGAKYSSVVSDNYKGGYMATEHLISRGYRSIALLNGPIIIRNFFDRDQGYRDALRDHNIPYSEDKVISCDYAIMGGYNGIYELYKRKQEVDAIFAGNDLLALGAMRALAEMGKTIPHDVAIVGFDDIVLASMSMPSLTTIKQAKYEMGQEAVTLLLDTIRDKNVEVKHIVLSPSLVIREST
jgi:LacI family transcriptional regulator